MCAIGSLNGVNACANPTIYHSLQSWGFHGIVRSDLRAVTNVANAFNAGMTLLKPGSTSGVLHLVKVKAIRLRALDDAVRTLLTAMFQWGLIAQPRYLAPMAAVSTSAHVATALAVAQSSIVLLKNTNHTLPLSPTTSSIAVLGAGAQVSPTTSGGGSSRVVPGPVVTPLAALKNALPHSTFTYAAGGPSALELSNLRDVDIVNGTLLPAITKRPKSSTDPGKADLVIDSAKNVTPAIATAAHFSTSEGWNYWHAVLRARRTGVYEVGLQQYGDTWLYMNGHAIISSPGLHGVSTWTTTVNLRAGRTYEFTARWFAIRGKVPNFGISDVSPDIAAAVNAARHAAVAVVFASAFSSEGSDRLSLNLSGDANALISAVAAVNPHTVVVLNSGGAVVMPWLSHVASVLEAWYPGQVDGSAIAPVLSGAVDPSGRLPITFPRDAAHMPATSGAQFPGVNSVVDFATGLNIGYRWYQANNVKALFPFGFGLDYTTFALSTPTLVRSGSTVTVRVKVTNTGNRSGADVVQAYVHYPNGTGEPPEQLRGFSKVTLLAHRSAFVTMTLASSSFQVFQNGAFTTPPGQFRIDLGQSSANLPLHLALTLR